MPATAFGLKVFPSPVLENLMRLTQRKVKVQSAAPFFWLLQAAKQTCKRSLHLCLRTCDFLYQHSFPSRIDRTDKKMNSTPAEHWISDKQMHSTDASTAKSRANISTAERCNRVSLQTAESHANQNRLPASPPH